MTVFSILPFAAATFSLSLAIVSLLSKKRSFAMWCFFAGMVVLGVDSLLTGVGQHMVELPGVLRWLTSALIVKSFVPAAWLGFSLVYSRGDYRESLTRWRIPLVIFALLPIGFSLAFRQELLEVLPSRSPDEGMQLRFGAIGTALNVTLLLESVWILMQLEQTFRSAVGTMRWRIKFVVLGLALIFGARIYVLCQVILFSSFEVERLAIESSALLVGCVSLAVAYWRTGLAEIDVYPSQAILRSSVTVIIAGGYLFCVGGLASVVRRFGGAKSFPLFSFVVLLGMAGLWSLLLSDRLRQRIRGFVNLNFARSQHDSVRIWTDFSHRLAHAKDPADLCAVSAKLISESFEVLSVSIWLLDEQKDQFTLGASTAPQPGEATGGEPPAAALSTVTAGLGARSLPFDLEGVDEPWAAELRQLNASTFPNGGHRWCIPLRAGERCHGALVLADRVNGAGYTVEELRLLGCISDQATSVLLNLRLANEVTLAREMEAFRTMSAFFVHDLKNAAASLNLMLSNLPVHFDDPAFREDALRGIGNTARRIDEMIGRLSSLRQSPRLNLVKADLNQLVMEALDWLDERPDVELTKELQPLPAIVAGREQIRSVVTNLLLNARDALGPGGSIRLQTQHVGDSVVLSVTDNGCGMSAAFLRDSLFRPFQSTKKKGLGIGMYQSRMIVEAHGGSIRVKSELNKGSTFVVSLPIKDVI